MTNTPGDQEPIERIEWGALQVDIGQRVVEVAGAPVQLTPTEWSVLLALLNHRDSVLQPDDLLRLVWGTAFGAGRDYVHVYINRLRRKLEHDPAQPRLIVTEQLGYRLRRDATAATAAGEGEPADPLPQQLTSFVGRERALAEVRALLLQPELRLLNLTGTGGTGKTRLALEAVRPLVRHWPHGVVFVALAPLRSPDQVLPAIAQALGIVERQGRAIADRVARYLQSRSCLLLLDNFEHLLPAAPEIGALLARAPHVTALVTSRARLHLRGEQTYAVPPFELPADDGPETPDIRALAANPAAALFTARAAAVNPGFALTPDNVAAVAAICRRLDGLPLAIELAAARTPVLEPTLLLERLDQRLAVLRGGPQDLAPHQQTLRDTIDWSFRLLEPPAQQLLAQLAVFAGGCTLEALEAVADEASASREHLLDALSTLVDHHLVQRVVGASGTRFALLETIHEYALEQLALSPTAQVTAQRFATYMRALAERAGPHLQSADQLTWLRRLTDEHDNLRAVVEWLIAQRCPEDVIAICGAIDVYLLLRGAVADARGWLTAALEQMPAPTLVRASGLLSLGLACAAEHVPATAMTAFDEALALFERHEDEDGIAAVLNHSGAALLALGERERGLARLEQSRALYRARDFVLGAACVQSKISTALMHGGELTWGLALADDALEMLREVGDRVDTAGLNSAIGSALLMDGQTARAIEHLERSLALYRELGALDAGASVLCKLGRAELDRAQPDRAQELLLEALKICRSARNLDLPPLALVRLAAASTLKQRDEHAARLLGAVASALEDSDSAWRATIQREYDAAIAQHATAPSADDWQQCWEQGHTLGLDATLLELLDRTQLRWAAHPGG